MSSAVNKDTAITCRERRIAEAITTLYAANLIQYSKGERVVPRKVG